MPTHHTRSICRLLVAVSLAFLVAAAPATAELTGIDIGDPWLAGSHSSNGTDISVVAVGEELWLSSDSFYFAYEQVTGDATITVSCRIRMSRSTPRPASCSASRWTPTP